MFMPADLPPSIPVFPLPGALLLPRTRLPLNIFEPRYLAMLEDVLKTPNRLIGMIQPVPTDFGEDRKLHSIGCAGRVTTFSEKEDGTCMITLTGASRFRLMSSDDGFTPYLRGEVNWAGYVRDLGKPEEDAGLDRAAFFRKLKLYFNVAGFSSGPANLSKAKDEMLVNSLSMLCPFDVEDKQALLEAPNLIARREVLTALIEFATISGGVESKLQ